MCRTKKDISNINVEYLATRFIHELIIHSNLAGYKYLIPAITLGVKDVFITDIQEINYKSLIERVAEQFNDNTRHIESSIRAAIDRTYRKYPECYKEVFSAERKPTPKMLIAHGVDNIVMFIKYELLPE